MSQKRPQPWGNPDFRHRTQMPAPAVEQIEQELLWLLSPAAFKPSGGSKGKGQFRFPSADSTRNDGHSSQSGL